MEPDKLSLAVLKLDEIVDFINKLGYKVDKSIIESSDSDTIVELYCSILEKLGVVKKDKLKIKFEGMGTFSYTGLHDRSIYIMKLFKMCRKFISEVIGVDNFSTYDLFTPIPKRTKRILSGLIKYFRFKQGEKETYNAMKDLRENSVNEFKEELSKFERSNMNYQKIKGIKEQELPQVQECSNTVNQINNTIKEIQSQNKEIQIQLQDRIKVEEELKEKMANIDSLNESIHMKITNLRGQIVFSPEKLLLLIEDTKANIETLSQNIHELENNQKLQEKAGKVLENIIKNLNEQNIFITDYEKVIITVGVIEKNIYEILEIKQKEDKTYNEISAQIDNKTKSFENLGQYVQNYMDTQKQSLDAREEELMRTNEKILVLNKKLNEVIEAQKKQLSVVKHIEDMRGEIAKIKSEKFTLVESEMLNLFNACGQYSTKFTRLLENN